LENLLKKVLQTEKNVKGDVQLTVSRTYLILHACCFGWSERKWKCVIFQDGGQFKKGKNINQHGPRSKTTIPTPMY
jgi:hypothetical protein